MGKLIVFEGVDGSGKSTQFELMCERLTKENYNFKRLIFPRYDEPSSALIKMYLGGELGNDPDAVNAYAASSFYAVDRYASFIQDWHEYYESGGLIVTDRYTTSNALHQGAKIVDSERELFFKWLYEYEFELLGLPKPDLVIYMDISAEFAAKRLERRQSETDTHADIHENEAYLRKSAECGDHAATQFGWYRINCVDNDTERDKYEIHSEAYEKIKEYLSKHE